MYILIAEVEEEVFAESYDDQEDDGRSKSISHFDEKGPYTKDDISFMVRMTWSNLINRLRHIL